jgi:hypothetical protein
MQDEGMQQYRRTPVKHTSQKLLLSGIILGSILAIGLIAWGVFNLTHKNNWPDQTLSAAAKDASYPIYYPATLPKGFSPIVGTPQTSADVFIYTLTYDGNKKLFVSAVPRPSGVQFSDFYNRILSNKTNVLNPAGTAVIGTANNQPIGSLVTAKTWVTVNAPKGIDTQRLQALVASLKTL